MLHLHFDLGFAAIVLSVVGVLGIFIMAYVAFCPAHRRRDAHDEAMLKQLRAEAER
jgi:hypothetical protein